MKARISSDFHYSSSMTYSVYCSISPHFPQKDAVGALLARH
jgi:hypothetical protein